MGLKKSGSKKYRGQHVGKASFMRVASRRVSRPIICVFAVLAAMGLGLMADAHAAGAEQSDTDALAESEIRGGGGGERSPGPKAVSPRTRQPSFTLFHSNTLRASIPTNRPINTTDPAHEPSAGIREPSFTPGDAEFSGRHTAVSRPVAKKRRNPYSAVHIR